MCLLGVDLFGMCLLGVDFCLLGGGFYWYVSCVCVLGGGLH